MTAALQETGFSSGRHRSVIPRHIGRIIPFRNRVSAEATTVAITDELLAISEFVEPWSVVDPLQQLEAQVLGARDALVKHDQKARPPFLIHEDERVIGERLSARGLVACIRQAGTKRELLRTKDTIAQRFADAQFEQAHQDAEAQAELSLFPSMPWMAEVTKSSSFSVRREVTHEVLGVARRRLKARSHNLQQHMRARQPKQA